MTPFITKVDAKVIIQHNPPHPGEVLRELYFDPINLSVTKAAKNLRISRPRLSDIVNGNAGISAVMAIKLAKAFNTSPYYWMMLQNSYDLWIVIKKQGNNGSYN